MFLRVPPELFCFSYRATQLEPSGSSPLWRANLGFCWAHCGVLTSSGVHVQWPLWRFWDIASKWSVWVTCLNLIRSFALHSFRGIRVNNDLGCLSQNSKFAGSAQKKSVKTEEARIYHQVLTDCKNIFSSSRTVTSKFSDFGQSPYLNLLRAMSKDFDQKLKFLERENHENAVQLQNALTSSLFGVVYRDFLWWLISLATFVFFLLQ